MTWDFADYSDSDSTASLSLLISERSQQLVLAAMSNMDSRAAWVEVDDATWDDIQESVANAYKEVMEIVVQDSVPVGMVAWFPISGSEKPHKWLHCDGTVLNAADYPELFEVLHSNYKSTSTFTLPDLSEKFLYGVSSDSEVGNTGGATTHTLTVAEMPNHAHTISRGNGGGNNAFNVVEADALAPSFPTSSTSSVGGGGAHNNMPPYTRGYWLIKALP